jgi:ribosomal-protein-alanine N-acetyltransferase
MKPQHLTLRLASRDDASRIATMSRDLIEAGLGWQYGPDRVRRLIAQRETSTLVAGDGATLAGFAIMSFGDTSAHLVLLAVRPAQQRRGVGRRMIEWLVASARTAGLASIHVELREANRDAYAFYRALDFDETLRLPGYYRGRETAVRMLRQLRVPDAPTPD